MVPGYAISRFAAKLGKKKHNRFKKMFVINMKYVIMEQIYLFFCSKAGKKGPSTSLK